MTRVVKQQTRASIKHNKKLIEILEYMATVASTCPEHVTPLITSTTSLTTVRTLFRELRQHNLIAFSHIEGGIMRNSGTSFWKLRPDALEKAKELFPLEIPVQQRPAVESHLYSEWKRETSEFVVRRDPMDVLLMWQGRAPSLNFRDSMKG